MKIAALFTGQGSQYVGMGKDLYDNYPLVKFRMDKTAEILGTDIKKICFEGPEEDLRKTENTQPAIYMISFICYRLLENAGVKFDAYAGFSLGEYSALAASAAAFLAAFFCSTVSITTSTHARIPRHPTTCMGS